MCGNKYFVQNSLLSTLGWLGATRSGGKKHDRSGVSKERHATLCVECEDSERKGTRSPLRSPYCSV